MKKLIYILFLIICYSCEDVIDVTLNEEPARLVIDASLNWIKGTAGNEQKIKLTLTAPYFNNEIPPANGAIISVSDTNNNTFNFVEDANTGKYYNNTFIPEINETYTLTILYNGDTYIGSETMKSVSPINYVEQKNDGGFSGEETEFKAYYTDPENEENYYLFEFTNNVSTMSSLEVYEDKFTNGNEIFGFYTDENLEPGNLINIRNYGVSKQFYNFMFILLQQNSEEDGSPFETQPTTVRGNCINQTNPDNYPLGYFKVSEVDEFIYTVN